MWKAKPTKSRLWRATLLFFAAGTCFAGQELPDAGIRTGTEETDQPAPKEISEPQDTPWAFSASVYGYIVPDSREYVQPTFTADRAWLHLETRYNYEDLETGSTWVGYNLSGGKKVSWAMTPMVGGVFGNTTGLAPGYKGSVSWWKVELYSEGEYVVDTGNASQSFFYNWSEVSFAPVEWLRIGMVTQRTRVYHTDREIQRGVLAGFSYGIIDLTGYVFNPDDSKPTVVLALAVNF